MWELMQEKRGNCLIWVLVAGGRKGERMNRVRDLE